MNDQNWFVKFVNQTQMASFGSFIGELRWTIVALGLGFADVFCLTRDSAGFQATGLALAGILVGALVVKTGVSAFNQKNVRETSREAYEGLAKVEKARGKANGTPAVAVEAKDQATVAVTAPANGAVISHPPEEHEWATGDDPRAGVL